MQFEIYLNNLFYLFSVEKEVEILNLLHTILKPTGRFRHKSEKTNFWKISIEDSVESFFLNVQSLLELDEKIRQKRNYYSEYSLTLQPLIIRIKNTEKQFGVYLDKKYYLFKTIQQALDICFKSFFVFDLKYPVECTLVWKFFENYVYKIDENDPDQPSTLISFIKNIKDTTKNV